MPTTDIMNILPVSDVSFLPQWQQEMSQQAGGKPGVADVGEELWLAKIGCAALTKEEAHRAEARINALRGAIGTFYVHNPRAPYPLADLNGVLLGASTVTIYALGGDNKSLRFAGLPVGYVLTEGDFFAYDTGEPPDVRRCLHQLTGDAVADVNGRTALVSVIPHLRAGVATGITVNLKKPAAEMIILPGTLDAASFKGSLGTLGFQALQVP